MLQRSLGPAGIGAGPSAEREDKHFVHVPGVNSSSRLMSSMTDWNP
jgi:hypothetical protein